MYTLHDNRSVTHTHKIFLHEVLRNYFIYVDTEETF